MGVRTFRLPDEDWFGLVSAAEGLGVKPSVLLRRLVREFLGSGGSVAAVAAPAAVAKAPKARPVVAPAVEEPVGPVKESVVERKTFWKDEYVKGRHRG